MGQIIPFTKSAPQGFIDPTLTENEHLSSEYERLKDTFEALNLALADIKVILLDHVVEVPHLEDLDRPETSHDSGR